MQGEFDLVVFDIAGTTVRDGGAIVARAMAGAIADVFGLSVELALVTGVMGMRKPDAIRALVQSSGRSVTAQEVDQAHEHFTQAVVRHYEAGAAVGPVPGALRTFECLRRAGVRVALDTGFSRRVVDTILARLHWRVGTDLDAVVAADEVTAGRPDPASIWRAMALCEVCDARRVAKVGDTPTDLLAGSAAGCGAVIGVGTGPFSLPELARFSHTALARDLTAVPRLLRLPDLLDSGEYPLARPLSAARVMW